METLADIELDTSAPDEITALAALAARAMMDNPISIAVFGSRPQTRLGLLQTTFEWTLGLLDSPVLVARRRDVVVGLAAVAPPHDCLVVRMATNQRRLQLGGQSIGFAFPPIPPRTLLSLLRLGPSGFSRFSAWGEAIASHDLRGPHHHLELVAVEPALKGMGIGGKLMSSVCETLRKGDEPATLETDTDANVRFYERFGFSVRARINTLGIPVSFMTLEPALPHGT